MVIKYEHSKIDGQTWLIEEKIPTASALSYLLEGSESALLIDTGMGLGDLRGLVRTLTAKPVTVVNTHAHLDHFGANGQFESFCFHEADKEVFTLHTNPEYLKKMAEEMLPSYLLRPAKMLFPKFYKQLTAPTPGEPSFYIQDGHLFELGGRTLEVIHTPGHSAGSVCLLDRDRGLLFGGDMAVAMGVLLHLDGSTSLEIFLSSMKKLEARAGEFEHIYSGHHIRPITKSWITDYIQCAQGLLDGSLEAIPRMDGKLPCRMVHYGRIALTLPR